MHNVFTEIQRRTKLPKAELDWLKSKGEQRILPRGAPFCKMGQAHHELGFLVTGILQVYTVSSEGAQVVMDFIFAGSFALALESAVQKLPSRVCIEAVTPSVLMTWPYKIRNEALARHPGWAEFETRITEDAFVRKQRRYMSLRTQSARQRYADLDLDLPPEWHDIPQHLIASYLDITPQYLSSLKRASLRAASDARRTRVGHK